jgi:hypothetical protein
MGLRMTGTRIDHILKKPTNRSECDSMGWHYANIELDIIEDFDLAQEAALWIRRTFNAEEFVLFTWGIAYFRHERDLLLFKLRWS